MDLLREDVEEEGDPQGRLCDEDEERGGRSSVPLYRDYLSDAAEEGLDRVRSVIEEDVLVENVPRVSEQDEELRERHEGHQVPDNPHAEHSEENSVAPSPVLQEILGTSQDLRVLPVDELQQNEGLSAQEPQQQGRHRVCESDNTVGESLKEKRDFLFVAVREKVGEAADVVNSGNDYDRIEEDEAMGRVLLVSLVWPPVKEFPGGDFR